MLSDFLIGGPLRVYAGLHRAPVQDMEDIAPTARLHKAWVGGQKEQELQYPQHNPSSCPSVSTFFRRVTGSAPACGHLRSKENRASSLYSSTLTGRLTFTFSQATAIFPSLPSVGSIKYCSRSRWGAAWGLTFTRTTSSFSSYCEARCCW
jgi:hypothetical protein